MRNTRPIGVGKVAEKLEGVGVVMELGLCATTRAAATRGLVVGLIGRGLQRRIVG